MDRFVRTTPKEVDKVSKYKFNIAWLEAPMFKGWLLKKAENGSERDFYIKAIDEIKEKFDFSDKIYDIINIVNPEYAQAFKLKSLKCFKERFEFVSVDLQNIDNEWKEHALLDHESLGLSSSLEAECYWKKVFEIKNGAGEYKFLNLRKVISVLLTLPFSNASVERIFSNLKQCKTDIRNKLHTDTIASIMYTKQGVTKAGGPSFEPPEKMYLLSAKDTNT